MENDTIAAIATPIGEGGIGIIRISGDDAIEVASKIFRPRSSKYRSLADVESYRAVYGDIVDDDVTRDEAIAIIMRAPHSYTTEDVCELQCHGGATVMRVVLELALKNGARLAERGEFTKRAFLGGRLDLSEAQAVMDVITAKTERSLDAAHGHLSGRFSSEIKTMRHDILSMIAHLEATIDFPEDDVEDVVMDEAEAKIKEIKNRVDEMIASAHAGRILREGIVTAIIGRPNVGKSSLLNHLLREERAIVTDEPGTTRDSIEEYVNIAGVPLRIVDTAGIRETESRVEEIGVRKAEKYIDDAQLVIAMVDASESLSDEDKKILALLDEKRKDVICLLNKSDKETKISREEISSLVKLDSADDIISFSTKSSMGDSELERAILRRVYGKGANLDTNDGGVMAANEREADILRRASESLSATILTLTNGMSADFVTIDLRAAWETLGEITGETVGDDVVDEIFSKFCIGK